MLTIDRNETSAQDAASTESVALVPLVHAAGRASATHRSVRPDPTFLAHLIATAEQLPQTRNLRRAAPADALSAYAAHLQTDHRVGRTRQVI
ncbi:hypothetical protein [Bradyrhizobium sp. STM 3843]|uniref:hypothetical protein n=1 Tax=Bradyrhizobium sp. STM 3843 TaxID=551947 RepID=UPI00055D2EA2|nr:hypothetical protein [Bradyrhizobium sp. STM 3843]